ncbi:hypothetical protein ARNL5_03511 [Anaerolineae bacterium]|nr:hypothetical protein ARNL5_03511 [Anaerolineae bacterium]
MHIRKIASNELETVVDLIARLQPDEEHHIGYFGMEADDIHHYLLEFTHGWENSIVVALHREQLVGCLAVEWDAEIGRAWLHGPCIDHVAWHIMANRLYAGAQTLGVLPKGLEEELFGDVVNVNLGAFARRHHFRKMEGHQAVLRFRKEQLESLPTLEAELLESRYHTAFIALHEKTFPRAYYKGQQILDRLDEQNWVFIITEQDTLLGYVYAKIDTGGEGYIDFVGVDEATRRRGIGKRLVVAATRWLLSFENVQQVSLTVGSTNRAAIELYLKIGFEHLWTLTAYRKRPSLD